MVRAGLLLGLTTLLLAGCDPSERGCADGEEDAWTDVQACAEYGTTGPDGGQTYNNYYDQYYDAVSSDEFEASRSEE